jgi:hypothetical protein
VIRTSPCKTSITFLQDSYGTIHLSATSPESAPEVVNSAAPQPKKLDAEVGTTMTTVFLERLGHKSGL